MKLIIIAISTLILFVSFALVFPAAMLSPGKLSKEHIAIKNDCFKCHTLLKGATETQCITCHNPKDIGRFSSSSKINALEPSTKVLFHQNLTNSSCLSCHTLHKNALSERLSVRFKHEFLTIADKNNCFACHQKNKPVDTLHQSITDSCITCHTTLAWKPATFNHDKYFLFDNNHTSTCTNCHTNANTYKEYTCYNCHEHSPAKIASEHQEEGITNFANCVSCHRSANDNEGHGKSESKRSQEDEEDD